MEEKMKKPEEYRIVLEGGQGEIEEKKSRFICNVRAVHTEEEAASFIEENGYEICGNIRESYIDGVWNKESEEEWLTEIQIPVAIGTVPAYR